MSDDVRDTGLKGRRVLVTGASTGIGEAIARDLAGRGAHVAVLARRARPLEALACEIGGVPVQADLKDPDAAADGVAAAASGLGGGLDALVNNAGTFRLGYVTDGLTSDWQDMVEVNILGLLAVTRAAVPHLARSPRGQIVNIGSMSGRRVSHPASGVYAGTKHAVHAMSEAIRCELHDKGIRVTVIAPGLVRTNHGGYITDPALRADAERDQREEGLDPRDVAAQVRHVLCTPPDVHLTEIAMFSARQYPS
ncbi:SDR family oxidoreductase [Actinomadura syzygii]|uniref:SDR family oxidoreductase n=1 Tax=Actinomadura syzygii TaxID=1427538 RepID=UPI001651B8E9|nr:SDR family oxidoreductase [Actinomadura syzygii]